MSRLFNWDLGGGGPTPDLTNQQYMIGKNSIPGNDLIKVNPTPPFDTADGPEFDTIIEHDPHACSFGAWINLDRLPNPNVDPFGQDISETFGLISRSVIVGGDLRPAISFSIVGDSPSPLLVGGVSRVSATALSASTNVAGALPMTINKWMFVGCSHLIDTVGPRLFYGELGVPMFEATYNGGDGFQFVGSGLPGLANPGLSAKGNWVDRWVYGPLLLGTRTLQVPPVTSPGQQYGLLGPNTTFGSLQGRLAHVTMWNGALTLAQWERLRKCPPGLRLFLPTQEGFPPLIADWWLDDYGATFLDHSGHGHDLVSVKTSYGTQPSDERHGSMGY